MVALGGLSAEAAIDVLAEIVAVEQEPGDVIDLARALTRTDRIDDARAAYELARALDAEFAPGDEHWFATNAARALAAEEAYGAKLDAAELRELVDDPGDAPLGDVLELVHEAASLVCADARTALARAGLADAQRLGGTSDLAASSMYPQIANALGGPPTLLHATASKTAPPVQVLATAPPIVAIAPAAARGCARARPPSQPSMPSCAFASAGSASYRAGVACSRPASMPRHSRGSSRRCGTRSGRRARLHPRKTLSTKPSGCAKRCRSPCAAA